MKTLILTRHCTTPWNLEGKTQGHHDTALHSQGIKEAYTLGARLQKISDIHIVSIISSDLLRAVRTAEIINTFFNNYKNNPDL